MASFFSSVNKLAVPFLSDDGGAEDDYALLPPPRPLGVLGVIGDNNPRLHTRVVIVRPFSRVQPTCQE